MKKSYTLLIYILFVFSNVLGQVTGDFQSKTRGAGLWNDYKSWEIYNGTGWISATSGKLPTDTTDVEIKAGDAMVINATSLLSGNLTVNGSLTYHSTTVSSLTVGGNVIVGKTGSFTSPSSGKVITHFLYIGGSAYNSTTGGDLLVDGVFNMNVNSSGVTVYFTGSLNNTISGTGSINFYSIFVDKG